MRFAVIGYPKFIPNGDDLIPVMRVIYPKLTYPKFESHFTFVFPQGSIEADSLVEHVKSMAANQAAIPFLIRRAEAVRDASSDNTYLFLVPDEGYDMVIDLHDRLYTGALAGELRADIPYVPHITVGYTADFDYCQQAADKINGKTFELRGVIDGLDVVTLTEDGGQSVAQIALR